ncbi:MAG: hypothetical protein R6X18_06830 [Chloroflexota bacterium]|jgi:hypothetical protein
MWIWRVISLILSLLVASGLAVGQIAVDDGRENQAVLVIDFGNGEIDSVCINFSEDEISGYEALVRSQIPVEFDFQSTGQAVCRIGQTGCAIDDCFCACRGGSECTYWTYWHFSEGQWEYSTIGAGMYRVRDGDIEGWVWGQSSITTATEPPLIDFEDVCGFSGNESPVTVFATDSNQPRAENWLTYGPLLGILLFLAAVAWLGRRRAGKSESK